MVDRIGALVDKLPGAALVVDATGVGRAVLDQMRESGLEPIPVTITGGRFTSFDGDHWRVPKKALLRPLVGATEAGRLKVAKGLAEAEQPQVFPDEVIRRALISDVEPLFPPPTIH